MNPYLESDFIWHDFHKRFIPLVADLLTAQVDPHFVIEIDEHVFIHDLIDEERKLVGRADVGVSESPRSLDPRVGLAVLDAPLQVLLPQADREALSFLEIRSRDDWELITVIELLSPSNKRPGPDRNQYLGKRSVLLFSSVHFVEMDLLRGGSRMPMEGLPDCDYCVLVSRAPDRPRAGIWPIRLRDPLPTIPIPLRAPHPDATLDLQAVVHRIYDAARYRTYIYARPPQPPLGPDDDSWAREYTPRGA